MNGAVELVVSLSLLRDYLQELSPDSRLHQQAVPIMEYMNNLMYLNGLDDACKGHPGHKMLACCTEHARATQTGTRITARLARHWPDAQHNPGTEAWWSEIGLELPSLESNRVINQRGSMDHYYRLRISISRTAALYERARLDTTDPRGLALQLFTTHLAYRRQQLNGYRLREVNVTFGELQFKLEAFQHLIARANPKVSNKLSDLVPLSEAWWHTIGMTQYRDHALIVP